MTGQWADELTEDSANYQPVTELEPFYILAAIEFGDPDQVDWMIDSNVKFFAFWKKYQHAAKCYAYAGPEVVLQYMIWYERERSRRAHT